MCERCQREREYCIRKMLGPVFELGAWPGAREASSCGNVFIRIAIELFPLTARCFAAHTGALRKCFVLRFGLGEVLLFVVFGRPRKCVGPPYGEPSCLSFGLQRCASCEVRTRGRLLVLVISLLSSPVCSGRGHAGWCNDCDVVVHSI